MILNTLQTPFLWINFLTRGFFIWFLIFLMKVTHVKFGGNRLEGLFSPKCPKSLFFHFPPRGVVYKLSFGCWAKVEGS